MSISTSLSELQDVLNTHGLIAGLKFMNARVPHRFTAVYQLSDAYLRRLGYVDKEGGLGLDSAKVPFKDSFCELAVSQGLLLVTDSAADARLHQRPNPFMIGSYVGLPLSTEPGMLYGTFCHYDTCSQPLGDDELLFMQQASELLTRYCLQPGVPLDTLATA